MKCRPVSQLDKSMWRRQKSSIDIMTANYNGNFDFKILTGFLINWSLDFIGTRNVKFHVWKTLILQKPKARIKS